LTKNITYGAWFDAIQKAGDDLELDPRLVALVQFMARRAAENDYAAAVEADTIPEHLDTQED